MEFSQKTEGTATVVYLCGRLDAYAANDVEKKLNSLTATKHLHLVLNLKDLDYISSSGLRVLLAALKRATKHEGDIRLARVQQCVKDVFDIAGFTQFFKMYDEEEEAINSF
jgi:anti-sigma B factor antagonist